jgi:DNA-binding response OmpR family regulator
MNNLAILDSTQPKTPRSAIRTGKVVVDLDTRIVSVDDQAVHLTGKEYGLLELLSLHKGAVVTKEMFLEHLYGETNEPELKIIDVFVCCLRKKLARATGVTSRRYGVAVISFGTRSSPERRPQPTRTWEMPLRTRQEINAQFGGSVFGEMV